MASMTTETLPSGRRSYSVRWREPTGRQRNKRFRTYSLARAHKSKVENQIDEGRYVVPTENTDIVADVVTRYIETHQTARATTKQTWRFQAPHIVTRIGKLKVGPMRRGDVEAWRDQMVAEGVPVSAMWNAWRLLKQALNAEVAAERLPKNFAKDVKFARPGERERPAMTWDDIVRISAEAERIGSYQDGLIVRFLGATGVRFGELAALRVRDVGGVVNVTKGVVVVDGLAVVGPTKTGKSRKTPLSAGMADEVRSYVSSTGKTADDVLFDADGKYLIGKAWRERVFYPASIAAGVTFDGKCPHVHDLRHAATSLWLEAGTAPHKVQRWLGHSSATMTDVYAHMYDVNDADIDKLDAAFGPSRPALKAV